MPQSHPTTGPVRFLSPVRFLACKAEWSARRNFASVLFPWSHQATGPVRSDMSAYLWFGWIIRRTPRVPRAMPIRALVGPTWASYGPRTGILNVFHIPRGPCVTRKGAVRRPYGHVITNGIDTTTIGKNPARASYLGVRGQYGPLTVPARAVHRLFTFSKPVRGP